MAVNKGECGLDLQKISEATIRVKDKFCRDTEEDVVKINLPDNDRVEVLSLIWAAKEALRKALGGYPLTGFTAMQLSKVEQLESQYWLFTLRVRDETHLIRTFFYKDFAIAICVI